jgi:hypothetical protein
LREIQQRWLDDSDTLDLATWTKRSVVRKYADRAVSLLSPLL